MPSVQRPFRKVAVTSAARTATGNSGAVNLPLLADFEFVLDVTAVSGTTPTLDLFIERSYDNGATWMPIRKFAQVTAVARRIMNFGSRRGAEASAEASIVDTNTAAVVQNGPLDDSVRYRWLISGTTPSFTFSLNVAGNNGAATGVAY